MDDTLSKSVPSANQSLASRRLYGVALIYQWVKTSRAQTILGLTVLLSILAIGARQDAALLLPYPVAVGRDGYYYVVQANSLLSHGNFYYGASSPFILYLIAAASYLIGDAVLGLKIVSILLHASLCLGVFALIKTVSRNVWLGVCGCGVAAFAGSHIFMVGEFVKNLGAASFLVWCGWATILAVRTRRKPWIILSVVLLIGATVSHRSAIFVALIMAISVILFYFIFSPSSAPKRMYAAIIGAFLLWILPAVLAAQPFFILPEWISREVLITPQWPIIIVAVTERIMLLCVVATILGLSLARRRPLWADDFSLICGPLVLFSLFIALNPFLNIDRGWGGIAGRLAGLAYIQIAVLIPGMIWMITREHREIIYLIFPIVMLLVGISHISALPHGMMHNVLVNRAHVIEGLPAYRAQLGEAPIVIAIHGDEFIVTATLGVPSQEKLPESDQYQTIHWLLHRVKPDWIPPSAMVVASEIGGYKTILVRDDVCRQELLSLPDTNRQELFRRNRHLRMACDPSGEIGPEVSLE